MNNLALFLNALAQETFTPRTLFATVVGLSLIAITILFVKPMWEARNEQKATIAARTSTPRFPRAKPISGSAEFLRHLHLHRPAALDVTVARWESDAYGGSQPVYKLSFLLSRNDAMSGSTSKEERAVEFRAVPSFIPYDVGSPEDLVRQLLERVQWGNNAPLRNARGGRGFILHPMQILLPGDVRAA